MSTSPDKQAHLRFTIEVVHRVFVAVAATVHAAVLSLGATPAVAAAIPVHAAVLSLDRTPLTSPREQISIIFISSVPFKRVSQQSEKPICAPYPISEQFPRCIYSLTLLLVSLV